MTTDRKRALPKYAGRNTSAGSRFEDLIGEALKLLPVERQVIVGKRLDGATEHRADFVVALSIGRVIVSAKWQAVGGSGEDKVLHEVATIAEAQEENPAFVHGYIVLGGNGWTQSKREYFFRGGFRNRIRNSENVTVIDLDDFLNLVWREWEEVPTVA